MADLSAKMNEEVEQTTQEHDPKPKDEIPANVEANEKDELDVEPSSDTSKQEEKVAAAAEPAASAVVIIPVENALVEDSKTTTTPTTTSVITLSDGEDGVVDPQPKQTPKKVNKKRRSMEGASSNTEGGGDADHLRLKRRKIRAAGAPKMPLTGYVRYMNERRESLKKEHPNKTANEHTKMIGEEWHTLAEETKTPYMQEAARDKERYLKELEIFLKEHPDVLAEELARSKARKNSMDCKSSLKDKSAETIAIQEMKEEKDRIEAELAAARQAHINAADRARRSPTPTAIIAPTPGEIPIFTNEFLEHNRVCDLELRALRKSKADLEQQNAVLEKHVENMKFGVEKMSSENDELQEKNRLLELYLEKLKIKLAQALSGLAIPTEPNGATVDNIDKYMGDLYKMATTNTHGPASLNKAKDIIRKLDLQIQL